MSSEPALLESRPSRPALLRRPPFAIASAALLLLLVVVGSLAVGRFPVPPGTVLGTLADGLTGRVGDPTVRGVVLLVRLPRVLLGALVGGGLAVAGCALQATFRNPLVSPQVIGVSSGASLGGVLAILWGWSGFALVALAFGFGLAALVAVFLVTASRTGAPMLLVVLGGLVTGSFFAALVSLVTYLANPYDQLPAIVFWLLGSLAAASYPTVLLAGIPILAGSTVLVLLRWRINVLSLGDDDAAAVGVHPSTLRWTVLAAVTLVVAGAVAVSGVVGWVGLVVPHLVRMWTGPDHRTLLPVSALVGAAFLVLVDTLARTVTAAEVPLGVITALVGAPVFFVVLRRYGSRVWDRA